MRSIGGREGSKGKRSKASEKVMDFGFEGISTFEVWERERKGFLDEGLTGSRARSGRFVGGMRKEELDNGLNIG